MAVALLDYNMGNLGSVRKALEFVGAGVEVVESGAGLAAAAFSPASATSATEWRI